VIEATLHSPLPYPNAHPNVCLPNIPLSYFDLLQRRQSGVSIRDGFRPVNVVFQTKSLFLQYLPNIPPNPVYSAASESLIPIPMDCSAYPYHSKHHTLSKGCLVIILVLLLLSLLLPIYQHLLSRISQRICSPHCTVLGVLAERAWEEWYAATATSLCR